MHTFTSSNESWGFFGTLQSNYSVSATEAEFLFQNAGEQFVFAGLSPSLVVELLDGRDGRHFADALSFHLPAGARVTQDQLLAAIATEMGRSATRWIRSFQRR